MSKLLVVDDESLMREFITESLISQGHEVDDAENGTKALELIANETYDVVLTDLKMPKVGGIDVLKKTREKLPDAKVIIMTAYGTVENAVEAMKLGAFDYITKPFSVDEILLLVKRALEFTSLQVENRRLHSELEEVCGTGSIVGSTTSMNTIFETIETVSESRSTVLITGESGTGKELVARAIHYSSPRSNGPFVKLNCAALPAELMESELFGHEKGAFTGAVRKYSGRFERADGGTLLLDEISEMSPHLQAKLLRVIQEREFEPVGSADTVKVDVRLIATTNRNLTEQIGKGEFREDLYYRLNVINIHMPPLRERKGDILGLAEHFLAMYNNENGKAIEGVSDDVMNEWTAYEWPGNVRELENAVERAVVMCKGKILERAETAAAGGTGGASINNEGISGGTGAGFVVGATLADMEKDIIMKTLEAQNGNRTTTADILGISVRTLRNKLTLYGEMDAFKSG
ncbi:sigma-54-dependent transcriptional regulator [Candidatus Latescibacterota bacterium]